jgi:hypothetical protein
MGELNRVQENVAIDGLAFELTPPLLGSAPTVGWRIGVNGTESRTANGNVKVDK